jgi:hypothetical protein
LKQKINVEKQTKNEKADFLDWLLAIDVCLV